MNKTIVTIAAFLLIGVTACVPEESATAPDQAREQAPASERQEAEPAPAEPSPQPPEPAPATVPALQGLNLAEAEQQLKAAGLILGEVERRMSPKPAGSVLQQAAAGGAALAAGSTVALVVAAPFPKVPSVLGADQEAAVSALEAAGFTVRTTTQTRTSGQAGVVLSQTPADSTPLRPGAVVSITISKVVPTLVGNGGGNCTPGYDPCLRPASDYDCAGGSGDGPGYAVGPIRVTGSDPYRLDSEGDGIACE